MGALGRREKPSEAKLKACRENARKPRRSAAIRQLREIAQDVLSPIMAEDVFQRIKRIMQDQTSPFEEFRWAVEYTSARIGLPAVTRQEHEDITPGREVVAVKDPIPWLEGGTDATAGDHGGGDDHRVSVQ